MAVVQTLWMIFITHCISDWKICVDEMREAMSNQWVMIASKYELWIWGMFHAGV